MAGARIDGVEQRHPQIIDEAEGVERLWQLKAARQPEPGALIRDQPVELLPVEEDAAGLVVERAAEAVDERTLARAVRPDEGEPLAGGDAEFDVVERNKPAEPLAEAADSEQRALAHAVLC